MSSHHYNRRASSPSGLGNSRGSPPRGSPMPYRGGGKGTTINNSDDMTAAPSVVTAAETVRTDVATVETVEEKIARQRKLMMRRENGEHKKKESATAGVPMVIRDRRGSSNDLKKLSSNVEKTTTRRRSDNSNNSKQDDGNGDTRRRINNERGGDKMISSSIEINISPKQDNGNGDTRRRISNERGGERKTSSGNGERRRDSGASSGDRRPSDEHGDRLPSGSSGNNNEVRRGSNSSSDRRPSDGSGNGERKRSTGSSGEHGVSSSTGRRVSGGNSNNERRSSGSSGGKTSEKIRRNRDGERSTSNGRRTTNGGSGRDNGPDKRRTDGTREKPPSQIQPSRRQHHHSQQQQQRQLLPPQPKPKIKEPAKRQPHPPPPVASNISSSSHRHDQLDSTDTHSSYSGYKTISSYGKDDDDDDMDLVSLIHEVKSDHHRQYRSGSKGGRGEIKTGREGQRSKTHHSGSGDDHHHHSRINDSIPIDHREAQQKRDSRTLSPPPVTRRGNRLRRPSNESKNNSNNNSKGDKIMTSKGRQKTTSNSRPESEPRVGRMSIGRRRPPQSPSQIKGRGNGGGGGESSDGEETATVFHPTGPSIKKKIKKRTTGGDDLQKAYLRGMKAANDGGNGESKTDTGSGMGGNGNGNNWISTSSKSTKAVNNIIKKNQEVYEPWLHRRDSLPGRPPSKEDVVDRKPIPNVQPLDPKGLDILNVGGIDMFTPQEHDVHDGDDPYLRRLSVPLEADSHFGDDQYRHSQPLNDKSKPIFPTMCVAGCQMEALEATHNKIIRGVKASKSFFPSDVLGVVRLLDGNDRCCDCRRGCMKEDYDKQQRSRRGGNDSDNREKKPIRMAKRLSLILNVTNDSGNMENMDDNNTSPDPVAKGLPIWASIPYGTLLCDECAFRHINISDEVIVKSKEKNLLVKSLIEDESWTLPEVISIVEGGNRSMISYMDQSKSKMAVYAAGGEESGTTDDDNNYNNRNNHYDKNGDHYEGGDGVGGGSRMNFTNKNDNEAFDDAFDAWYRGKAAMKYRKILRRRVELVLQETGCLLDSGREKVTTSASNIVNYEKGIVTMDASDGDNENNLGGTNHAIFSSDGSDVEGKGSKSARRLTSISTFDVGQLRIRRRASIGEDTVITRQTVKTYGR